MPCWLTTAGNGGDTAEERRETVLGRERRRDASVTTGDSGSAAAADPKTSSDWEVSSFGLREDTRRLRLFVFSYITESSPGAAGVRGTPEGTRPRRKAAVIGDGFRFLRMIMHMTVQRKISKMRPAAVRTTSVSSFMTRTLTLPSEVGTAMASTLPS